MRLNKQHILLEIHNESLLEAISNEDLYDNYYKGKGLSDSDFNKLLGTGLGLRPDGTAGPLTKIMIVWYIKGMFEMSQLDDVVNNLRVFEKNKSHSPIQSLEQLNNFDYFMKVMSRFDGEDKEYFLSQKDQSELVKQETKIIYNDEEWLILTPLSKKSSIVWGKGTKWCTASTVENMFNSYNNEGPLLIFVDKNKKDDSGRQVKYQFHFKTSSFMNSLDIPIPPPILSNMGIEDQNLRDLIINMIPGDLDDDRRTSIIDSLINKPKKVSRFSNKRVISSKGDILNLGDFVKHREIIISGYRATKYLDDTGEAVIVYLKKLEGDANDDYEIAVDLRDSKYTAQEIISGFMGDTKSGKLAFVNEMFLNINEDLRPMDFKVVVRSFNDNRPVGFVFHDGYNYSSVGGDRGFNVRLNDDSFSVSFGSENYIRFKKGGLFTLVDEYGDEIVRYNSVDLITILNKEILLKSDEGKSVVINPNNGVELTKLSQDYTTSKGDGKNIIGNDSFFNSRVSKEYVVPNGKFFHTINNDFFILTNGSEVASSNGGVFSLTSKIVKILTNENGVIILCDDAIYTFSSKSSHWLAYKYDVSMIKNVTYTNDRKNIYYVYQEGSKFIFINSQGNDVRSTFAIDVPNFSGLLQNKNAVKVLSYNNVDKVILTTNDDVFEEKVKVNSDFGRLNYNHPFLKDLTEFIPIDYPEEDDEED